MDTLKHILLKEEVQELLDSFCAACGIRILLYDPEGRILRVGRHVDESGYCRLLQKHLFAGEGKCLALDARKRHEASLNDTTVCYRCHSGLHEAVQPIRVRGKLLGHAMIGQFRSSNRPPASIERAWSRRHKTEELHEAFNALPYIQRSQVDHVFRMFQTLVDYIVTKNLVSSRGYALLEEIQDYLRANAHRRVPLTEIARRFHRSPSTLSHLFKQKAGISFQDYQTKLRIERAESYLQEYPEQGIAAAAAHAGYTDALYFSRLYKKHRGHPPSHFLKHQSQDVSKENKT